MARKCRQGLLCSLLLLSGCAEVRSAARVRQLESQLRDLKERQQQSQERQEELENRVLVLQDQLDSARAASSRSGAALSRSARSGSRKPSRPARSAIAARVIGASVRTRPPYGRRTSDSPPTPQRSAQQLADREGRTARVGQRDRKSVV